MPTGDHNKLKRFCRNSHEYTPENTYINGRNGSRQCRACRISRRVLEPKDMGRELDPSARRRLLSATRDGVTKEDRCERFGLTHKSLAVQLALAEEEEKRRAA
jgi:hypothetical protein